jgi:hypothetical protein
MFAELRQGRAELRAWVQAGCPGLTPEIEAALSPGTRELLRRFAQLPEDGIGPQAHSEPGEREPPTEKREGAWSAVDGYNGRCVKKY